MLIFIVLLVIVTFLLVVVFPNFFGYIARNTPRWLNNLTTYLRHVLRDFVAPAMIIYVGIILAWLILSFLILVVGVAFNIGFLIGISGLMSIFLVYFVFLLPGVIRKILGKPFLITALGLLVSWQAAISFIGLLYPEVISFKLLLGLSLLAFLSVGLTARFDLLSKVVVPVVTVLCLLSVYQYMAPDNFRAVSRNFYSYGERFNTWNDRRAITNQAEAGSTYGKLLENVKVAYQVDGYSQATGQISLMHDVTVSLSKDSVFLVINHKKDVSSFEGQTFVHIKLPDSNGSYISGKDIWIDADLIELGTRKDLEGLKDHSGSESASLKAPEMPTTTGSNIPVYGLGIHPLNLAKNQKEWVEIKSCRQYNFNREATLIVETPDGKIINSWDPGSWPHNVDKILITNLGNTPISLIVE